MKKLFSNINQAISVGILVAATGVGAGDIVMASLAGSKFGLILLWAVVVGAILKYVLNEGLAKWDIATGTTLLQGWVERLPKIVSIYFGIYLIFWAFLVAGTLISYTGLVANTIFPLPLSDQYGVAVWGGLQSIFVVVIIFVGGFSFIEDIMKFLIGLMFLVILMSAAIVCPSWPEVFYSIFFPSLHTDTDSILFVFALIGGIGGSLTILCYSYWLREKKGLRSVTLKEVKIDLGVAYFLTALFGIAVMIIAAGVNPDSVSGYGLVISIAEQLDNILGDFGKWSFLLGFWGAILSSMIGVWNGVPYLFVDFINQYKLQNKANKEALIITSGSLYYRIFLFYLALPPIFLTLVEEPNWIGVAYAISGAFFMPFLAALILYMNNRKGWVGSFNNGWITNFLLLLSFLLFIVLFVVKIRSAI